MGEKKMRRVKRMKKVKSDIKIKGSLGKATKMNKNKK